MNLIHKLLGRESRPQFMVTAMAPHHDDLRAELVKVTEELGSLQRAMRLMGFDPAKVAQCVDDPADACLKAILLASVGLDEDKLKARAGTNTNMEGWRHQWEQLRSE